jgi:hypothetical protein
MSGIYLVDFQVAHSLLFHMVLSKEVLRIGHSLEFQGISTGVLEEHCPLFPRLAFEADMGLYDELDTCCLHPFSQGPKVIHRHC